MYNCNREYDETTEMREQKKTKERNLKIIIIIVIIKTSGLQKHRRLLQLLVAGNQACGSSNRLSAKKQTMQHEGNNQICFNNIEQKFEPGIVLSNST